MANPDVSDQYKRALARSSFGTPDVREALEEITDTQRERLVEKLRQARKARQGE